MRRLKQSVLAMITLAWGCGSSSPSDPNPSQTTTVTITPGQGKLESLQETLPLQAVVRVNGQTSTATPTWTSLDPGTATVDGSGVVRSVANGTARITAAASGVADTAEIVVQQVAATVTLSPNADALVAGATRQLTAEARDHNQFVIAAANVTWSSADQLVATVNNAGLVTGVGQGTTTISGTVNAAIGTSAITVSLAPLAISHDTTLQGTVNVASLSVAAGAQVTLGGDLTLKATGDITIGGTLQGNCRSVVLTGDGALNLTGVVRNSCSDPSDPGKDLRVVVKGRIGMQGALVESSGEIEIANTDATGLPALRRSALVTGPRPAPTDLNACDIMNSTIGAGTLAPAGIDGSPKGTDGAPGNRIIVRCDGEFTASGAKFFGEGGGRGGKGTATVSQPGRGGNGGRGGDVWLLGRGGAHFLGSNTVFVQSGGRGGDATGGPATLAEAYGGDAGDSGVPLIGFSPNGTLQVDASGLDIIINSVVAPGNVTEVKRGGAADATAKDGADATPTTNAQQGDPAKATGGKGGSVQKPGTLQVLGDIFEITFPQNPGNVGFLIGDAGIGGPALVFPGRGGNGIQQRPRGGTGGNFFGIGGEGGSNLVLDNRVSPVPIGNPGKGGSVTLIDGKAGLGFNGCAINPFVPGGQSGDGGIASGMTGAGGVNASAMQASRGDVIFQKAGNAENGSDGAGPASGGTAGAFVFSLFGTKVDDGQSFKPGTPGAACQLPLANTATTVETDPSHHHNFDGGFDHHDGSHRAEFDDPDDEDNLRALIRSGGTASAVTPVYAITIKGQSPWRTLTGIVFSDDSIRAGTISQFAGFNNVQFDLLGKLVKDTGGAIIGYDALLTVGGRHELPTGQPIVYRIMARP